MAKKVKLEVPDEKFEADQAMSDGAAFDMRRAAAAIALRRIEGLRLFEPMPVQAACLASKANERIIIGSNQSGKTLIASYIVARAVCGLDEMFPKTNGIAYCVGFDGRHIADPMWKKLSRPGAFKIIRDKITGMWRAYRPWLQEDLDRVMDSRPAPALIPQRMIESISWEIKKENQPKMVKLTNGWEMHFFSGNAKPPQGSQADLGFFDEEIADASWYAEVAARLLYKRGKFIWSATPQVGTDRLFRLHERALEQVEKDIRPRTVEEFFLHLDNNVHMAADQAAQFADQLDEDDRDVRIGGEFAHISRVFPEYSSKAHEIPFRPIPPDWTRYIAIDPGRQVCASLFLAIPPPNDDDAGHVFIYDEIYIRNSDVMQWGEAMEKKCQDQRFREFIIDHHESAKTESTGLTKEEMYRNQLRLRGIRSDVTGNGFSLGAMNIEAGVEKMRSWLKRLKVKKVDGVVPAPIIRVIAEKCPNLIWEIKRYRYKRVNGVVRDVPEQKNNDLLDCLRYLAMSEPEWHAPARKEPNDSPLMRAFKAHMKAKGSGQTGLLLGPGMSPK